MMIYSNLLKSFVKRTVLVSFLAVVTGPCAGHAKANPIASTPKSASSASDHALRGSDSECEARIIDVIRSDRKSMILAPESFDWVKLGRDLAVVADSCPQIDNSDLRGGA